MINNFNRYNNFHERIIVLFARLTDDPLGDRFSSACFVEQLIPWYQRNVIYPPRCRFTRNTVVDAAERYTSAIKRWTGARREELEKRNRGRLLLVFSNDHRSASIDPLPSISYLSRLPEDSCSKGNNRFLVFFSLFLSFVLFISFFFYPVSSPRWNYVAIPMFYPPKITLGWISIIDYR